jgi:hypothetical protein
MAIRLATLAIVPVKSVSRAVNPLSNGEPPACASAATGKSKGRVTIRTVGHHDTRRVF